MFGFVFLIIYILTLNFEKKEEEKIKGSFEKPMSPSNEADDLALQLREINSDYQNEIKQETETGGDSNTGILYQVCTKQLLGLLQIMELAKNIYALLMV